MREVVEENQKRYGRQFVHLDVLRSELPFVDLILCRDCLVHFSFADVQRAIGNMRRSGSRYLLTTTFMARTQNTNIATGQWTPYNFQASPFNFPEPLAMLNERYLLEFPHHTDKSLGLWCLADLNPEV